MLGQKSYIRQYLAKSPWYDEFIRDMTFCDACFFVGYSLADPHITALIRTPEASRSKTYFILRGEIDPLLAEHIREYGETHSIETKGFAELTRNIKTAPELSDLHALRSLKYIDPFRDQKALLKPTPIEIFDLVAIGHFNSLRCFNSLPRAEYVAPRREMVETAVSQLIAGKTLLLHSRLGNGKSIFLWLLAFQLASNGYSCFHLNEVSPNIEREIQSLGDLENVVVMMDSYDVAVGIASRISELLPKARFVVNVRTGIQEVRLHEILTGLPQPVRRLSLNELTASDRADFIELLENAGLLDRGSRDAIRNSFDVREVVTGLYKNKLIQRKIKDAFLPMYEDGSARDVLILALILSWIGQSGSVSFFFEVTGGDPYASLSKFRETAIDIFSLDGDQIQARSPVFAEYLLQNHFDADHLLSVVERVILAAVQRKSERRFRAILGSLMRFSQLMRLLNSTTEASNKIRELYGRLQRDVDLREEPLFWLQYTISMINADSTELAEKFLDTAYEKARSAGDFATYQLDTQSLRLLLLIETKAPLGQPVERIERIFSATEIVKNMISDQTHRSYAIKVVDGWLPFITRRGGDLTIQQRNRVLRQLDDLIGALSRLSEQIRAETGADLIRGQLERAKAAVLLPPKAGETLQ
ncbi:hypothetical protein [Mesorhizobium sp.]|uniref:hypothetical protein n=1 Tax=Mesorhizobium sp. TaxID=1871066 RepID=UPI00257D2846|nr:hypothetical protein [Mesorhizobium sp.]